jgi:hypothetical protein
MPDITDNRANLEAVIAAAGEHDASHVFANVLFLKPLAQQAFFPFLERHFPHLRKRYAARFARSAFLDRGYKDRVLRMVAELKQKHGFSDDSDSDTPATLHEADAEQLPLLQIESDSTSLPCIGDQAYPGPRGRRLGALPTASRVGGMPGLRYSRRSQTHPTPWSGRCD